MNKVTEATEEIIEQWREEARAEGMGWMLVIHDDGLDEDYPAFYPSRERMEEARLLLEKSGYQHVRHRIEV